MCGIAGIAGPDASRHDTALARMVASVTHRGPDGSGVLRFDGCALGHTRLSVIDAAGGAQPMATDDGRTAVVFNGEIYGFKDLKQSEFGSYGFRTSSDTELLLAMYERDAEQMLDRLPGMFAFALWDERRRQLFCARDRFGEKPFFYATAADGTFAVFASELKGILASGLIDPVIDPDSVAHYLRYLYVHPRRTIYRNVHVLPAAHRLTYRDGRIEVAPYWRLPSAGPDLDIDDAAEQFRELLTRAVTRQLVADVPVGAFLSGGLDSSTLVALVAGQRGRCKTFSFGFGPVIDELPFARGIAERYHTEHIELTDTGVDVADLLMTMSEVYDEPFGDSSNIPTYLLCRQARRHVTVALTGEGADELLGGYTFWYRPLLEMAEAGTCGLGRRAIARVAGAVARRTGHASPAWAASINRGARLGRHFSSLGAAHAEQTSWCSAAEAGALVPEASTAVDHARVDVDTVDGILRSDLTTYLPGDILVKADRASMAHGLELRAPFLDWDFASFCISLPTRLKIDTHQDKVLLRRAFADAWTPSIRARGKQGFGAPIAEWLTRPSMRALTRELLGNPASRVYDLLSRPAVEASIAHDPGRTWPLLVLASWLESSKASLAASA